MRISARHLECPLHLDLEYYGFYYDFPADPFLAPLLLLIELSSRNDEEKQDAGGPPAVRVPRGDTVQADQRRRVRVIKRPATDLRLRFCR